MPQSSDRCPYRMDDLHGHSLEELVYVLAPVYPLAKGGARVLSRIFAKPQAPGQLPPRTTSHLLFGWNHGPLFSNPVMEEWPTIHSQNVIFLLRRPFYD